MNILAATLVLMAIGCVYSQNLQFERLGQDLENQFSHMGQDFGTQMNNLGNQMNSKASEMGNSLDKQMSDLGNQMNNWGNQMSSRTSQMGNSLDKQMSDLGNQMNNWGNQMSSRTSQMSNSLDKQMNNLGNELSNIHFTQGRAQYSSHSSPSNYGIVPDLQEMMVSLHAKCQSTGHPEVPELIEIDREEINRCLKNTLDMEKLQNDLVRAMRAHDIPNFFALCEIWPKTSNCIKNSLTLYKLCLSPDEVKMLDKVMDLADASNSFFCDNNAEHPINFLENNGFQCIDQNREVILNCVVDIAQKVRNSGKNNTIPAFDEAECSNFQDFRRCVVRKLRQCSSSVPSQITDDYFALIYRKACNSASRFTWLSFVNIVLLFFTYLYSKMF
ncbi:27 kDa hemolymph protein-like [Diorhabda carinulata]|uniref:27 kDa hemolymph protein-like n=1 Tax=Diorhabda carinulata TaxID=1163345 RepID=UPI0025A2633E|nr:27 kDa hemolymph protein-like [Diorhabda carinulata]